MGVVVVQIGQGGNQMGCALFQCLASMAASTPWEFFRPSSRTSALTARSILVDMEPKVLSASYLASTGLPFEPEVVVKLFMVKNDGVSLTNEVTDYKNPNPFLELL
jgi:hypothetical protein